MNDGNRWRIRARRLTAAVACLAMVTMTAEPATAGPVGTAVASTEQLTAGDAYLRDYMTRTKAPGMAYAVVRGDRVLRHGAWGVDGDGRPMTAQTPFMLGSTSKSFTALAVQQLTETGRVDPDAPAHTYLPWLRLGDESTARTVTVRQLLTHTSGLPKVSNTTLTDRYDNQPGGLARSVRDLATLRPTTTAGQTYQYSDANYMILGALVENITGDTFGAYLRRHVFDPLSMTRSAATAAEAHIAGVPAGHRYYLGRPQRHAAPFDTAGAPYGFLAASLDDLSHYAIAQLNGGRYRDTRILRPDSVRQMHTGTADTGHGSYGFGWKNSTLDGTGARMVWHSGATPNYFSHLVLVPDSNLAVIVLTNIYGLAMDEPLNAGAFGLTRILHGDIPATGAEDPTSTRALAGLCTVAAALLALLVSALITAVRTRRRRGANHPIRSRRRTITGAAAWTGGCAAVAAGAAWAVPLFMWGAGLAKVRLWAPDMGHAILTVVALAAALALTRLAISAHTLLFTARSGQ